MDYLSERQGLILQYLRERGPASIRDVQEFLGISSATIYRDISGLVNSGMVHRSRGRLVYRRGVNLDVPEARCVMCGGSVNARTAISIHLEDGAQVLACCPHCGLMYITRQNKVSSALATDFLYGKIYNVSQVVYLLESQVQICCAPSLLCFASLEDANKFQTGFGGRVLSFEQALHALQAMMSLNPQMQRIEEA